MVLSYDFSVHCPHLPAAVANMTAGDLLVFGKDRGAVFYELSLTYAHTLWQRQLPAQALLQLNRALGADLAPESPILQRWPLPYAAVAWMLCHRPADAFLGNPRRHYQHLATRMVPPRRERRAWRAWACWALARRILPYLPADREQLVREALQEPEIPEIARQLALHGSEAECQLWLQVMDAASPQRPFYS
jgi:hypothetical protein